jgi:spermidine synthase
MSTQFEELDYRPTPLGALSLRPRHEPKAGRDILEIKLGDEYLMSSLFTASEEALARLALADLDGSGFDVVVGGLGLGYTARAVLENANVDSLVVVELMDAVAEWHEQGLLPLGPELTGDPRCRFVRGDFFALAATAKGFVAEHNGRRYDAVLVDIDHAPDFWLAEENGTFYSEEGLRKIAAVLRPGGVFGLWSNDRPDGTFVSLLSSGFEKARAEPVTFPNPLQDNREATQTVYVAQTASDE